MHNCTLCKNSSVTPAEGLRARKQRETREAIHRAAVRFALADGPDNVTVADISAEANVSSRTFFNYFPGKEDAMLGFHDQLPTAEELAAFVSSEGQTGDLLSDVVSLMRDVFSASSTDSEIVRDRRSLLHKHPQLMQRQMARIFAVEQRVADVVALRMRASTSYADLADVDAAARMLVLMAISVVRFAIREATSDSSKSSSSDVDLALEKSLNTLREVMHKLQ